MFSKMGWLTIFALFLASCGDGSDNAGLPSNCHLECENVCGYQCWDDCVTNCHDECGYAWENVCHSECSNQCDYNCDYVCYDDCSYECDEWGCDYVCYPVCYNDCGYDCHTVCGDVCHLEWVYGCDPICSTSCTPRCGDRCTDVCETVCVDPNVAPVLANPCGNGVLDPGEECDGLHLANATCFDLGFDLGEITCASDCTYDTSACAYAPCVENCDPPTVNQ